MRKLLSITRGKAPEGVPESRREFTISVQKSKRFLAAGPAVACDRMGVLSVHSRSRFH
jgi:hypothetical protein